MFDPLVKVVDGSTSQQEYIQNRKQTEKGGGRFALFATSLLQELLRRRMELP